MPWRRLTVRERLVFALHALLTDLLVYALIAVSSTQVVELHLRYPG